MRRLRPFPCKSCHDESFSRDRVRDAIRWRPPRRLGEFGSSAGGSLTGKALTFLKEALLCCGVLYLLVFYLEFSLYFPVFLFWFFF